jgi:hypothetical protein
VMLWGCDSMVLWGVVLWCCGAVAVAVVVWAVMLVL